MMFAKKIISKTILLIKHFQYQILLKNHSSSTYLKIPYYSQWESKNLVKDIIYGKINAEKDPKWKNSGAKNTKEYLHWSWNGCGMVCLKMILAVLKKKNIPIVKLGKKCMDYGGYRLNKKAYEKNDYKNSIDGLFYKPFVLFIKEEFNLKAKILSYLVLEEIIPLVNKRHFVIVSANPQIRKLKNISIQRGGHLVLIVGYNLYSKSIFVHNPSGVNKSSQAYAKVSFGDFEKFFAHKGIVIFSKK